MACTLAAVIFTLVVVLAGLGTLGYVVLSRLAANLKDNKPGTQALVDTVLLLFTPKEDEDAGDEVPVPDVPEQAQNQP